MKTTIVVERERQGEREAGREGGREREGRGKEGEGGRERERTIE
jgi:hypothetical protein